MNIARGGVDCSCFSKTQSGEIKCLGNRGIVVYRPCQSNCIPVERETACVSIESNVRKTVVKKIIDIV